MARYDYYCPDCKARKEVEMSMDQIGSAPIECPVGHVMRRIYTPVSAIFRGGGWAGKA